VSRPLVAARSDALDRLAAGLYAWIVTVAMPSAPASAPLPARLFALTAVVTLGSGALLSRAAPRTARLAGVWLFVGACVGAWATNPAAISTARLDPVQGALGSVGWGLFALSWAGERTSAERVPASDAARTPWLSRRARVVVGGAAVLASGPMVMAWWVPGVERALFAHGAALAVLIALVTTATRLVVRDAPVTRPVGQSSPAARVGSAFAMLLALSLMLLAGAAVRWLR
jgi:hypothetical protein